MSGRHTAATSAQVQHVQAARTDRTSYAKVNGGHPHTLAVAPDRRRRSLDWRVRLPPARETGRSGATARTAPSERTRQGLNLRKRIDRARLRRATQRHRETESRTALWTESPTAASPTESRMHPLETSRANPRIANSAFSDRTTPIHAEGRTARLNLILRRQKNQGQSRTLHPRLVRNLVAPRNRMQKRGQRLRRRPSRTLHLASNGTAPRIASCSSARIPACAARAPQHASHPAPAPRAEPGGGIASCSAA